MPQPPKLPVGTCEFLGHGTEPHAWTYECNDWLSSEADSKRPTRSVVESFADYLERMREYYAETYIVTKLPTGKERTTK